MTGLGVLHAAICLARGGAPTSYEICAHLLSRSAAGAVVAVTPEGSYLDRSLPALIPSDRLFRHPPVELAARGGAPGEANYALEAVDRDCRVLGRQSWPPRVQPAETRLRRLDTLYADSHRVDAIVVDAPTSAAAVLHGAERVLSGHQPIVVIDLSSIALSARLATWEACAAILGNGYQWYDGALLPCDGNDRRLEAVMGCASQAACALPLKAGPALSPGGAGLAGIVRDDVLPLAALAWADWRCPIPVDGARREPSVLAFDDQLCATDLHPAETDGSGLWWRWTGPGARTSVRMPWPAPGRYFLKFDILNWGVVPDPAQLELYVGAERHALSGLDEYSVRFGPVAITAADLAGSRWIHLVSPPPRRASGDDPRRIGIGIIRCVLEPS